jgi:hypothetical protein
VHGEEYDLPFMIADKDAPLMKISQVESMRLMRLEAGSLIRCRGDYRNIYLVRFLPLRHDDRRELGGRYKTLIRIGLRHNSPGLRGQLEDIVLALSVPASFRSSPEIKGRTILFIPQ